MIEIITNNVDEFIKKLEKRGNIDQGEYAIATKKIVLDVLENKDEALFRYTNKFDNPNINASNCILTRTDMQNAYNRIDKDLIKTLELAKKRIEDFHKKQLTNSWLDIKENGEILGMRHIPIENVGIYVPGGKASYPSSVLMNAIPARVAGVKKIVMATPNGKDGINDLVLAAAYIAGVDIIYQIGGAQAIAAMAYGTETVLKVDKIVGPGNIYVALAKKEVFGSVSIDSIAGPSEILVIADKTCNPKYVACDLLGQAEHDELASAILLTNSMEVALEVKKYVNKFYNDLSRKSILDKSLKNYSKIIVLNNIDECINLANLIAPEHLELAIDDAFNNLGKIKNAGAVFVGNYTPEAVGDYIAGANHVLPTSKTARAFSPLNVDDFMKKSSVLSFTKEAFNNVIEDVNRFALAEGLDAHALSAKIRGEE